MTLRSGIVTYVTDPALDEAVDLRKAAADRRREAEREEQLAETLE
jgi:hypothetical protein